MKSTPNKLVAFALVVMLCSCSTAKRKMHQGLEDLVEKELILHAERHDLNDSTTRQDSVYVVFEDDKFKSFYGFNAYMDFETLDGKTVSYGYGKSGAHYTDPVKSFYYYYRTFKYFKYTKTFSRIGSVKYSSDNLDTIVVRPPIKNSVKRYSYYTLIFNDSSQLVSITERFYDELYYMNDSNVISINEMEKPPSKDYFYPKLGANDSVFIAPIIVADTTTKMELPFKALSTLDSTIHVSGPVYQQKKSVVVYSYISCAPCAVLKNKLKEETDKGKLNDSLIVVLNTFDEEDNLLRFIARKGYEFPYYKTQEINTIGYGFPMICGYDENGNLEWTVNGYAPSVVKQVVKYLSD